MLQDSVDRIDRLVTAMGGLQAELLAEIAAVDRSEGWRRDGAANVESWLVARLAVSHATARVWAEVAGRLGELPAIEAGLASGRLSFDQVRVLTRFAEPDGDTDLASEAETAPVSRLQREARRRERLSQRQVEDARRSRSFRWWWDHPAGLLRFQGALAAADGERLVTAVRRLADQAPRHPDTGMPVPAEHRHADALVQLASQQLGADADPDRATVVVHVTADGNSVTERGTLLAAEVAWRLACDARLETVREHDRVAVGIGRASRRIPAWLARQLRYRDQGCRFPGCERSRWVHAHHLVHWMLGGPTDLDNLISLCDYHHRLGHEHRWRIVGDPNRDVTWIRPDGTAYHPHRTRLQELQAQAGAIKRRFIDELLAGGA